jgi:uncharacterized membrane protein YqiK
MTSVPIGNVGVVVAYVGERVAEGDDVSGDKQIRLVRQGQKGVWDTPLDPGKYPINPYTHKVENVPTTNIVLNWAEAKTEAHELDANLSTIKVRSSDGFTFNLDVSQIIHIARSNAPKVIARFGNMANLVTQVLEPLIGNYFRNSAQTSDVIGFLSARAERQAQAKTHISEAVSNYNVQAVDTLIGDITPPEELMKTLTDRKVAEQQKTTYTTQKEAEETRADLANARALADTKPQVVDSLRQVEIKTNLANARVEEAKGEAGYKKAIADADAHVLMVTGKAQGENTLAVGGAEADVLRKKVGAVGQHGYVSMQIADFLATNRIQLVPNFLVQGGGADGKSGSIADAFVAFMLAKQAEVQSASTPSTTETAAPAATA